MKRTSRVKAYAIAVFIKILIAILVFGTVIAVHVELMVLSFFPSFRLMLGGVILLTPT